MPTYKRPFDICTILAWGVKQYSDSKRVLHDGHSQPLFGPYDFFNVDTVMEDIDRISGTPDRTLVGARKQMKGLRGNDNT